MKAWQDGANFRELIEAEPEIASRISRKQIERAFDLNRQLRNVDKIFARVFGDENGGGKKVSRKPSARSTK